MNYFHRCLIFLTYCGQILDNLFIFNRPLRLPALRCIIEGCFNLSRMVDSDYKTTQKCFHEGFFIVSFLFSFALFTSGLWTDHALGSILG